MASNSSVITDEDGDYPDWIELYNKGDEPVNLNGFTITDKEDDLFKWFFPDVEIAPRSFLLFFASDKNRKKSCLHTNFKINADGEILILCNRSGHIIDRVDAIKLETDCSYGRIDDGSGEWGVMSAPTPGKTNNNQYAMRVIDFSNAPGFYRSSFYLSLNCTDSIYYTLDGSVPTPKSKLYTDSIYISADRPNQISLIPTSYNVCEDDESACGRFSYKKPKENIDKAAVVRARSFKNGVATSKIYSSTYFTYPAEYTIPVFSIITDNENLFNLDSGIYVPGKLFDEDIPDWTGNSHQRGRKWEREGHLDFFVDNKRLVYSDNIGFRISGQKSRTYPQKSLRLYFRKEYGENKLTWPIFQEREYCDFKRLTLRSGFTYWWGRNSLFQDDFIHKVAARYNFDVECQMSSPAILFINGEYWGIHNMRERQDEDYVHALYPDIEEDNVDIMNGNLSADEGSSEDFVQFVEFVENNSLEDSLNYEYAKEKIDVSSYIDYYILETYFGNVDWPMNNIRFWRSSEKSESWRCLLYDLDASMNKSSGDPFKHVDESSGIQAFIFRAFNENNEFRKRFVERYVHHLKKSFKPDELNEMINQLSEKFEPEVQKHIKRWGNPEDVNSWRNASRYMQDFIEERPRYIIKHLNNHYGYNISYSDSSVNDKLLVKVFPNPAVNYFTVDVESDKVVSGYLNVYNTQKQKVYSQYLSSSQNINTNSLVPGVYIVQVLIDSENILKKVIVVH